MSPSAPRPQPIDSDRIGHQGSSALTALPVAVTGPVHLVAQVSAWVESRLGWQVTDGVDLPAVVHLAGVDPAAWSEVSSATDSETDVVTSGARQAHDSGVPVIALVSHDDPAVIAAEHARGAAAVVAWPQGHERIESLVSQLLGAQPETDDRTMTVAGSAGGVGTTIVAISLAAWVAWQGGHGLAVVHGDVPVAGAQVVDPAVVAGHRAYAAAWPVADVPGLRVVGTHGVPDRIEVPDGVTAVVDVGVQRDVGVQGDVGGQRDGAPDVLVVRRDRVGLEAIERSACGAVVVTDIGQVSHRDIATVAAGRPMFMLPWSSRVARAHDHGRIPGSLPGRWLAVLQPLAPASQRS